MKVLLEFKKSHHYWEEWKKVKSIFCPHCGKKEVWEQQDYTEDQDYACTACGYMWVMSYGQIRKDEWAQIPKQLKAGVANKPTTLEGN